MAGLGSSIFILASSPAKSVAASCAACVKSKKLSFFVNRYAPVKKSCVAAIKSSPFLGVTKLLLF